MQVKVIIEIGAGSFDYEMLRVEHNERLQKDEKLGDYKSPEPIPPYDKAREKVNELIVMAVGGIGTQIDEQLEKAQIMYDVRWDQFKKDKPEEAAAIEETQARIRRRKLGLVESAGTLGDDL